MTETNTNLYALMRSNLTYPEFKTFISTVVQTAVLVELTGKSQQYVARKRREHNEEFIEQLFNDYQAFWTDNKTIVELSPVIDETVRDMQRASRDAFNTMEETLKALRRNETEKLRELRKEAELALPNPKQSATPAKEKTEVEPAPLFKNPLDAFYEEQDRLRAEQRNKD